MNVFLINYKERFQILQCQVNGLKVGRNLFQFFKIRKYIELKKILKIFVISTHNCTHVWMRMHAWNLSEFTSSIKRTAYNRYRIELYEAFTSVCKKYKIYTPTVMKGTILSRAGLMLGFTIRTIQFRILNSTPSVSIRLSLLIQVYRIRLWNPF